MGGHNNILGQRQSGAALGVVLALLTMFGPVSMDLYLPVLPTLARDVEASASAAQLTMTACLLGLAAGQLIAGPISDRAGRRPPLLVGVVVFVVSSVLCAVADSIVRLVTWRLVQGLAGGVGLVIAQAAGRDIYEGARLTRYYARIVVLSGLAAIIAPVIGGQLATVIDWRGFFYVLAGIGAAILVAALVGFRETLPRDRRMPEGWAHTAQHLQLLSRDRLFVGALLASSLTSAAYFAYLGGASFVLQEVYGLTPAGYSLVFALNAAGFALFGFLAGRAAGRLAARQIFLVGLAILAAGGTLFLVAVVGRPGLPVVVLAFFAIAAGAAFVSPPSTSLALTDYPQIAGTAASVLGVARFSAGALAAPLTGLGGALDMVPLALVVLVSTAGAAATYRVLMRPRAADKARRAAR